MVSFAAIVTRVMIQKILLYLFLAVGVRPGDIASRLKVPQTSRCAYHVDYL